MKKLFATAFIIFSLAPLFALAQAGDAPVVDKTPEYTLLAPIPLTAGTQTEDKTTTAGKYIQGIVRLSIALAAGLAVLKIIFGGIQYMSTDAFSGKSEAKGTISNAIWGLLLVISSVVILNTINPKLVQFKLHIAGLELGDELKQQGGGEIDIPAGKIDINGPALVGEQRFDAFGCVDCVSVKGHNFKAKPPGEGCKNSPTDACILSAKLTLRLDALALELRKVNLNWQVSELFPPTRPHKAQCQQVNKQTSGACADASIDSGSRTPANIMYFLGAASLDYVGLRAVYEVESFTRQRELLAAGIPSSAIAVPGEYGTDGKWKTWISGEHFSIYSK